MEKAVDIIIAWAARKGGWEAKRIDGLTKDMIDRGWQVISAELGAEPAIQKLVAEARETGDAGDATCADAATALQQAATQDADFAKRLRAVLSTEDSGSHHPADPPAGGMSFGDVRTGNIRARNSKINSDNKIINKVRANPVALGGLGVIIVIAVIFGIKKFSSGPADGPKALAGSWTASDGSGIKTFNGDGACDGFYYNNGKPLDIGGPMFCTVDKSPGSDGRYTLTVKQSMNQATYKIKFDSHRHAIVYSDDGDKLYELSRS